MFIASSLEDLTAHDDFPLGKTTREKLLLCDAGLIAEHLATDLQERERSEHFLFSFVALFAYFWVFIYHKKCVKCSENQLAHLGK